MPGKDPGVCIITILFGIAGEFFATFLGKFLGIYEPCETAGVFFGATLGTMIVLWLYKNFLKRK